MNNFKRIQIVTFNNNNDIGNNNSNCINNDNDNDKEVNMKPLTIPMLSSMCIPLTKTKISSLV